MQSNYSNSPQNKMHKTITLSYLVSGSEGINRKPWTLARNRNFMTGTQCGTKFYYELIKWWTKCQVTFLISSSSLEVDWAAWCLPKCCLSKRLLASSFARSWNCWSLSTDTGRPALPILSLYNFKQRSTMALLKTSTSDPVDGISPLFKASTI